MSRAPPPPGEGSDGDDRRSPGTGQPTASVAGRRYGAHVSEYQPPPVVPGRPPPAPYIPPSVYPPGTVFPPAAPPRRRASPVSIAFLVTGILALLAGIGMMASAAGGAATASPSPSPSPVVVYVTVPGPPAAAATTTAPATTGPPPAATISGGGIFLVPGEVKPGTYRTVVPAGEHCYWARLRGTSGAFDDIIANGNGDPGERMTVTIKSTDKAFQTEQGCGTWTKIG